ncbi:hypothetical protein AM1_3640 [Acaryochloris marina MBIC11017]|uniref:Uncharacterized protein n=1 Tax=Acaryochloris marina (strain MBIC 11017) TaxID=329726 RepID=B0C3D1_ACAM1|nr:hypothetical protein AM1_3640 [Acaryochloris marina MBIC11017]
MQVLVEVLLLVCPVFYTNTKQCLNQRDDFCEKKSMVGMTWLKVAS